MDVLDYFEELSRKNARTVAVRYYYLDFEAQLAAARLRDGGVPCFVSNALSSTNLPTSTPGIGLNVLEEDLPRARAILSEEEHREEELAEGHPEKQNPGLLWLGILLIVVVLALLFSQVRI